MKKNKIIILSVSFLFLIILSLYFDSEIVNIISLIRNNFLNDFFLGITSISSTIIIFFFLTSLFLWREHKRKWILPLWFTLGLSVLVSFVLKITMQRPRPFQLGIVSILPILEKASHNIWNFSFPSFHSMLIFCALPILSKQFKKFKYFWIVFAGLVAFSRVYFGLHFLSDAIVGGVIGFLLGIVVIKIEKQNNFFEKIYKKVFRK